MNKEELNRVLGLHKLWLENDVEGKHADLRGADIRDADLRHADLRHADLRGADLGGADLGGADLGGADLRGADLRDADLRGADLRCANLRDADLRDADLRNAGLGGADLRDANLIGIKYNELTSFFAIQCPEEGSFIGYKKSMDDKIIKLLITEDALRSSATSRKCRCSKAKVLEITGDNGEKFDIAVSKYDNKFEYRVGEIVSVDDFDTDRWNECAAGIHFFLTKQEAINY